MVWYEVLEETVDKEKKEKEEGHGERYERMKQ
jgi:hypothetical protein